MFLWKTVEKNIKKTEQWTKINTVRPWKKKGTTEKPEEKNAIQTSFVSNLTLKFPFPRGTSICRKTESHFKTNQLMNLKF